MPRTFSSCYLAGDPAACAFFPLDFRDAAARAARAGQAAQRKVSPAVAAVLREQQATLPSSRARRDNLDALLAGNTAVVVSGQQVGLFLGPLYTFYKAASAVAIARAIQAESGVRCVPLFWLQTEDHDFVEIASCVVASERDGGPVHLTLADGSPEAARRSIAHRVLGAEVARRLDDLAEHLGTAPFAGDVLAVLRAHYVAGRPLAQAFAGALAEVFSDEGLLFLDPRDERLARQVAPLYRRALDDAALIDRSLGDQAGRLAAADLAEQVPLRPGSPLVFVHPDGARGPRFRLQRRPEGQAAGDARSYVLAGTERTTSAAEVLARLEQEPLTCSTSALLRPLVQDTLLPTVAYVGGPAEISYFAQLMPLYQLFELTPPLVIPRARFRCIDARARRLLDALALAPDDLARPTAELLARVAVSRPSEASDPAALRSQVTEEIAPRVAALADAIVAARPELARAAERTRRSVAHALERLNAQYARALFEKDTVTRDRLTRLQNLLQPEGAPQERTYGWPSMAARVGSAAFKEAVFAALAAHGTFVTHLLDLRP